MLEVYEVVTILLMVAKKSTKIEAHDAGLEHERLTSLINSMGDGVLAIDEKFKIVITNGAALNILDVNESLPGQDVTHVLQLIDKNNQKVDLKEVIKDTKTS